MKVVNKCAILGASGHGKVVAEIAELNGFGCIEFYDDKWPSITELENWKVVGDSNALLGNIAAYSQIVVAIGNNSIRFQKYLSLKRAGACQEALVHPNAVVSKYASVDFGCVVFAGAVVNPFAKIGESCILNTGSVVEHDCHLGDGVHISPNASLAGGVTVSAGAWIGLGATVNQLLEVGQNAVVGAGATAVENVPKDAVVVGTPAKEIKQ